MTVETTTGGTFALWRGLAETGDLVCPACQAALDVAGNRFTCTGCHARYPVENGVPLLMRPQEVVSVPGQVARAFNIPPGLEREVEAALAPLMKYRTPAHGEFANFFARFEERERHVPVVPLGAGELSAALAEVECLTRHFPDTLRSDAGEHRSLRLRNGSGRVLFTDERCRLFLSYRLFTPAGEPVPCDAARTPLPVPLRPGDELTVPALVRLPANLSGRHTVRFHFLLADQPSTPQLSPPGSPRPRRWRDLLRGAPPAAPPAQPATHDHWFDTVVAEMQVTAVSGPARFPAEWHGALSEFDVHQDVSRAETFLRDVVDDLRARGVARPRVLEIGAGIHPVALRTCDADMTVVVSDISLVMQTLAALMHANNPAVRDGRAAFTSFDTMFPPFANGAFDIVCICAAFHHIPAPVGFLQQVAPLLSPDGRFVALREPCTVNPAEPMYLSELASGFNEQMFELPEWLAMLDRGGFAIDRAVIDFGSSLKFSARRTAS